MKMSKIIKSSVNIQIFFIFLFYLSAIVHSKKQLCTGVKKYKFGTTIVGHILVFGGSKNNNITIQYHQCECSQSTSIQGCKKSVYFTPLKLTLSILSYYFTTHPTSRFLFLHTTHIIIIIIIIIIGEIERNSNQNSTLEFQFFAMCPKLFILKEFYFLILESNMGSHHKYSFK